jgi:transposase
MLAKTFGCARVIYNDAIRLRQELYHQGEKISDTELQKRLITQAKLTDERRWLSEVGSVPLVQSLRNACLAFRNFFKSVKGERKGRKVGFPKFKKKHSTQSIQFTSNGFSVKSHSVYLAKIGCVRVKSIRYGRDFQVISRWKPTSQRCSDCGQLGGKKPLDVREWTCLHCGATHDRDINAAMNIQVRGRAVRDSKRMWRQA